jgi:purine-binding chemotaxis protein CheW
LRRYGVFKNDRYFLRRCFVSYISNLEFVMNPDGGRQPNGTLLVFHLAGQLCGVSLNWVQEIVPMARLSRPPGLPSIIEGFLNLGGTAVSVLRLDRLFNLGEVVPGLYTPLAILRTSDGPIALLVDDVSEIVTDSPETRLPIHEKQSFNGCAEAEVTVNGRTIHLLSPERILLEQERRKVTEFQALEQQRLNDLEATLP